MASQDNAHDHGQVLKAPGARAKAARTPVLYGGYDSVTGALRSEGVRGDFTRGDAHSEVKVSVCEGLHELATALHIEESLSVQYLKIASGDQKLDFLKEQKATAQTVSIVVYARHETGTKSATNYALNEKAAKKTEVGSFVDVFGDSFIDSVTEGGEYYGVYTFYSQTSEEQQKVKGELKAKGVFSGVTAALELKVAISNATKDSSTGWKFDQRVSGIVNPQLPTRDDLIAYALAFPTKVPDAPVVIGMTTQGYEHVDGFELDFKRIKANRRYFTAGADGGLASALEKLAELTSRIDWLRGIYATYRYKGDTALDAFAREVEADRKTVRGQIDDYEDDPEQVFKRPALPSLEKGMPVLSFDKGTSSMFGAGTGGQFDFGSVERALQSQRRLVRVQLRGQDWLDRIMITYRTPSGVENYYCYGGEGGRDQAALALDGDEFLKTMNVRVGGHIDRLEFITTSGATTGVGGLGANQTFNVPDGAVALGFQGRYGLYIDALQLVWAKLKPAEFRK